MYDLVLRGGQKPRRTPSCKRAAGRTIIPSSELCLYPKIKHPPYKQMNIVFLSFRAFLPLNKNGTLCDAQTEIRIIVKSIRDVSAGAKNIEYAVYYCYVN